MKSKQTILAILLLLISTGLFAQTPCGGGAINTCRSKLSTLKPWEAKIITMEGPDKIHGHKSPHDAALENYFVTLEPQEYSTESRIVGNPYADGFIESWFKAKFNVVGKPPNTPDKSFAKLDESKPLKIYTNNGALFYPEGMIVSYEDGGSPLLIGEQYQAWMKIWPVYDNDNQLTGYEGSFTFGYGGIYTTRTENVVDGGIEQPVKVLVPEDDENPSNPLNDFEVQALRLVLHEYTPHITHRDPPSRKITNPASLTLEDDDTDPPPPPPPADTFCTDCYAKGYYPWIKGDPNVQASPNRPYGEAIINVAIEAEASLTDKTRIAIRQAIASMNRTDVDSKTNELVSTGFYFRIVPSTQQANVVIKPNGFNQGNEVTGVQYSNSRTVLVQEGLTGSTDYISGLFKNVFGRMIGLAPTKKNCLSVMNPPDPNLGSNDLTIGDMKAARAANGPNQNTKCKKIKQRQKTDQGGGGEIVFAPNPPYQVWYPQCSTWIEKTDWYACLPNVVSSQARPGGAKTEFLPYCTYQQVGSTYDFITVCR